MNELAVKIENVSKQYRLGAIGGGTLKGDLQTYFAKLRGKEDPNSKVGSTVYAKNEKFLALQDINLEIKKGEAVGIIGHNGAGKSTLLKLLTRVTAPTTGQISINGRIASMLEVGTGFHPELSGRDNVYLNGAILGMSKAEIAKKFDEIVEFSEVKQFIDTPVKRYSSGMYVKLAFSVAAHLDSEIMIMDEVLAVGDMKFQKKCLKKMKEAATIEGRTVLYVSHNMNTIRSLCDRCVVLEKGKVVFHGDVESAIDVYIGDDEMLSSPYVDLSTKKRPNYIVGNVKMKNITFLDKKKTVYSVGDSVMLQLEWESEAELSNVCFRALIINSSDIPVGVIFSDKLENAVPGRTYVNTLKCDFPLLVEGKYYMNISLFQKDDIGGSIILDTLERACVFEFVENNNEEELINWSSNAWGSIRFPRASTTHTGGKR